MLNSFFKKPRPYTQSEIQALSMAVNQPITLNGVTELPLFHAIQHGDMALFKALLRLGADYQAICFTRNKKQQLQTIEEYLAFKAQENPLCYKAFLNNLSNTKLKRFLKTIRKNILLVLGLSAGTAITILDIALILMNLLPSYVNLTYMAELISDIAASSIFGLLLNTGILGYKLYRNLTHTTKNTSGHLITLGYDLINYILKSGAYISFIAIGASPLIGILILSASLTDATRGITKLARAVKNHILLKRKINDPTVLNNPDKAIKAIQSYQRANFKIATISTHLFLAGIIVALVAISCFMPLTFVGTASISAATIAIYGIGYITKLACNKFFQHRAEKKITEYYQQQALSMNKDTDSEHDSMDSSHQSIMEQLHTTKISSNPEIAKADHTMDKSKSKEKSVTLSTKTYRSFKLLETILKVTDEKQVADDKALNNEDVEADFLNYNPIMSNAV